MSIDIAKISMKDILKIKRRTWMQLAIEIKRWIEDDMRKGFCQFYASGMGYVSRQYREYKNRFMDRKTGGGKVGQYLNRQVLSNEISTVNMYLTGDTIKGLRYKSSTKDKMIMTYAAKDEKKIIGNESRGRYITTLNDENQNKVVKYMEKQFEKNIRDYYKTPVKIKL